MLALVTILALADAAPPIADGLRLATAEVSERIALPEGLRDLELDVAPLERVVRLRVGKLAPAVAARIALQTGADGICAVAQTRGDVVELACRSNRIDAALVRDGRTVYLDLHLLRGIPWRAGLDGPPMVSYESDLLGPGETCPGKSAAARGECALAAGNYLEAARHYRRALKTAERPLAQLRLGDLALLAEDPATALAWYQRANSVGLFGRMAAARLCELDLACVSQRPQLDPDPSDLHGPMRDDLVLRRARVEFFLGRPEGAVSVIRDWLTRDPSKDVCRAGGAALCRRLVGMALRASSGADAERALELFLVLPERERGPLVVELHADAAEAAARVGAPVFGGNLLSSVTRFVKPAALEQHLLRTAELYLVGDDAARARVILEFAATRWPNLTGGRWARVRRAITTVEGAGAVAAEAPGPAKDDGADDLAKATALSLEVRKFLGRPAEGGGGEAPTAATREGGRK